MASSFRRITRLLPCPSKLQQAQLSTIHNRSILPTFRSTKSRPSVLPSMSSQQQRPFSGSFGAAPKESRMQTFSVYRWDPAGTEPPKEVNYEIDVSDCPMILDVLIKIKNKLDTVQKSPHISRTFAYTHIYIIICRHYHSVDHVVREYVVHAQ